MLIALTGGIGSGKTTVAEIWRELGASIIDADELAREVVVPGSAVLNQLVATLGPDIVSPDGGLNRPKLAKLIFGDAGLRSRVESVMHPAIQQLAANRIAAAKSPVVYVIPLFVETNSPLRFDAVVNITVPESVRLARLTQQRGMTASEAAARIAAQAGEAERIAKSDYQIDGNCSLADLRIRASKLFTEINRGPER